MSESKPIRVIFGMVPTSTPQPGPGVKMQRADLVALGAQDIVHALFAAVTKGWTPPQNTHDWLVSVAHSALDAGLDIGVRAALRDPATAMFVVRGGNATEEATMAEAVEAFLDLYRP